MKQIICRAALALALFLPLNVAAQTVSLQRPLITASPVAPTPDITALVYRAAAENGIDPRLFAALVNQESRGRNNAVSSKGARGLAQLMPGTAARFGVANPHDPAQNLSGGARYLRYLLDLFGGNVRLALAGYNAGEGAVLKYGRRIPPYAETIDYVERICRAFYGQSGLAQPLVYQTALFRKRLPPPPIRARLPAPVKRTNAPVAAAFAITAAPVAQPRRVSSYYW